VFGQLGDGTTTRRLTPVQVLTDVVSVAAGESHSLAIRRDATLWAWGLNVYGQLGDGTAGYRTTPIQVLTDVGVLQFSPYPHGYSFRNWGTQRDSLSIQCKLRILFRVFNVENVDTRTITRHVDTITFGYDGNCFGMAASAVMEFKYPHFDQILENQTKSYVYYLSLGNRGWDGSKNIQKHPVLKHIIAFQISQIGILRKEMIRGTNNVLNILKEELPRGIQRHILGIFDAGSGHALVPFRIETVVENEKYRLLVYDSNHPGDEERPVIIERNIFGKWSWSYYMGEGTTWSGPGWRGWLGDNSILLIPISVIYNDGDKLRLPGTRGIDEALVSLSGEANLLLIDAEGRMAGLKDGVVYEEIPGVELIFPMGPLPNQDRRWQPTFYISNPQNLAYVIQGITAEDEEVSLVKFGRDYFIDFSSLIEPAAESKINISGDGTSISISDHNKKYDLVLNKNVEGISKTLSLADIPVVDEALHRFIIDWDALAKDADEPVDMKIDAEGDGVFEQQRTLQRPSPSFRYSPEEINVDQPVTFDASGSSDPDGKIISYQWDFGDGTTGAGKIVQHTFTLAGSYTVTLTVADNHGVVNSSSKVIAVMPVVAVPVIPVTGVTITPETATINVGDTQQLTVTVLPADATNRNITWTSNNPAVARVDANGLVTGVAAGTATITVTTVDGGFTDTSVITVVVPPPPVIPVTGVTLTPETATINVGDTQQLIARVLPADATNRNITWTSNNPAIAKVDAKGLVTGVAVGTAIITVTTADGGFRASSTITVLLPAPDIDERPPAEPVWGIIAGIAAVIAAVILGLFLVRRRRTA
jgi:uncharacterized protein YjdB